MNTIWNNQIIKKTMKEIPMPVKWVTREEYETHDCHASEDDGCAVCVGWQERQDRDDFRLTEEDTVK